MTRDDRMAGAILDALTAPVEELGGAPAAAVVDRAAAETLLASAVRKLIELARRESLTLVAVMRDALADVLLECVGDRPDLARVGAVCRAALAKAKE